MLCCSRQEISAYGDHPRAAVEEGCCGTRQRCCTLQPPTHNASSPLISQAGGARKSKVVWQGFDISIQVQTLDEYYMESELSSMAARAKELACREDLCQELERRVSLFKFSRDLLHWLFASSSMRHPPSSERIVVKLRQ